MSQYPLLKVKKPDGRKYITELEKLICQSEPSEIAIGRKKTIVLLYQTIRKTDLDRGSANGTFLKLKNGD